MCLYVPDNNTIPARCDTGWTLGLTTELRKRVITPADSNTYDSITDLRVIRPTQNSRVIIPAFQFNLHHSRFPLCPPDEKFTRFDAA